MRTWTKHGQDAWKLMNIRAKQKAHIFANCVEMCLFFLSPTPSKTHKISPRRLCARALRGARCALVAGAGFEPTTFGLWAPCYDYFKLWWFQVIANPRRFRKSNLLRSMLILFSFWNNSALLVPWGEIFTCGGSTKIWNLKMLSPKPFFKQPDGRSFLSTVKRVLFWYL